MANQIRLKRASGSDPGASDLVTGELAVRTDNGKVFTKKDDGNVVEVAGGIADGDKGDITVSNSGATFTIDSGVIDNANIASDAAISASKISGVMPTSGGAFTGNVSISDNAIEFDSDAGNTNKISLQGPSSLSASFTLTLPNDDGSNGQVLGVDGLGNLSFGNIAFRNQNEVIALFDQSGTPVQRLLCNTEGIVIQGQSGSTASKLQFRDINTANHLKFRAPNTISNTAEFVIPDGDGSASTVLKTDGSGNLSFGTIVNASVDASAAIAGSKIDPDFGSQNIITTGTLAVGNQTITSTAPSITFTDSDSNPDYQILVNLGAFAIRDQTSGVNRLTVASDGQVSTEQKLNCNGGLDTDGDVKFNSGTTNMNILFDASQQSLEFDDSVKATFGFDRDLQVYHDSSHSYIDNVGTGDLKIRSTQSNGDVNIICSDTNGGFTVKSTADETLINSVANGAVELYFNGNKKIESTNTGGTVSGTLLVSSSSSSPGLEAKGDGSSTDGYIQLNCSQNSHGIKLSSPSHSAGASYTFTFPDGIVNGRYLTTDANGNTSWGIPTDNNFTDALLSKLNGIATGATNVTNNNQLTNGAGYVTANTQLTEEQVEDFVGGMLTGNTETGITVTYQDSDGTIDFVVASQTDENFTTTLKNKLDGIAANATNVTNNNQLTNGAGYITSAALAGAADGGNAALLDGIDSTQFLRSDADDTTSGNLTLSSGSQDVINLTAASSNDNRGIAFNSRTALSADQNDGYLRLNNASEFSNGVYTPGLIRADNGFFVDGTSKGINGSGNFVNGTISGASDVSTSASTNTIVKRDSNGFVHADFFKTTASDVSSGVTKIMVETGNDNFIRHGTAAAVRSFLNVEDGATAGGGLPTSGGTLTGTLNSRAIIPTANNSYDLGSNSLRFRNIFTNDLNLSNKGSANKIDKSWGDFTIQEGSEDLFIINNRNGKMYKFMLQEVD